MLAKAKSRYVRISPYKLRPSADVVRGKRVEDALAWLKQNLTQRTVSLFKVIQSAYANLRNREGGEQVDLSGVIVGEIRVDQGPIVKYFKPGARGRSDAQRKRLCHIEVVLSKKK
ncbi:50S ribosomal protein L22 [bacterium]|jgi:large subunit ribosomal protein L22|nr:50S ribosomal protein L22 [bacterium]